MIDQQLLAYIKECTQNGMGREAITGLLTAKGWPLAEINEAFGSLPVTQTGAPKLSPQGAAPASGGAVVSQNSWNQEEQKSSRWWLVGLAVLLVILIRNYFSWQTILGNQTIAMAITGWLVVTMIINLLLVWTFAALFRVENNHLSKALSFVVIGSLAALVVESLSLFHLSPLIQTLVGFIFIILLVILLVRIYATSLPKAIGIFIIPGLITGIIAGVLLAALLFTGLISFAKTINSSLNNNQIIPLGVLSSSTPPQSNNTVVATSSQSSASPEEATTGGISVSGMQQYTDSNFGFSFWYPSTWTVVDVSGQPQLSTDFYNGPMGSKLLRVSNGNISIDIHEYYSATSSITNNPSPADGVEPVTYFFDSSRHEWMQTGYGMDAGTVPANVSINTMGGLHMLSGVTRGGLDTIIPLSAIIL